VENSLWKRPWACRKTDYRINEIRVHLTRKRHVTSRTMALPYSNSYMFFLSLSSSVTQFGHLWHEVRQACTAISAHKPCLPKTKNQCRSSQATGLTYEACRKQQLLLVCCTSRKAKLLFHGFERCTEYVLLCEVTQSTNLWNLWTVAPKWSVQKRKVARRHTVNAHGRIKVQHHALLTSALDTDELLAPCSGRFNPEKRIPSAH
jgi:hypothetical protein